MNTANVHSKRRLWQWLIPALLVFAASLALLRWLRSAATYGDWYGLPSKVWLAKEAERNAHLYWWILTALTLTAIIVTTVLVPPLKSKKVPGALKVISPFFSAVLIVLGSMYILVYGIAAAELYLR